MVSVDIELIKVSKEFPGVMALDEVSCRVAHGHIHGLLGPNGAGKSTMMKIIAGLLSPSQGRVEVRAPVGLLLEDPPLYPNMRVMDFLEFVAAIQGVERRSISKQVRDVVEQCGLGNVQQRLIGNLSKGYKQRVGVAQALVFDPSILVLDEPTVGLDPIAIEDIRELIRSLSGSGQHTVLLSTHLLHEVNILCSEITIINRGQVVQSGGIEAIQQGLQKNLQTKQVIRVEVAHWNASLEREVMKALPFEDVEVEVEVEVRAPRPCGPRAVALKLFSGEEQDLRPRLSEFLIKKNCDLLSLKREQLDMEDIFRLATQQTTQQEGAAPCP